MGSAFTPGLRARESMEIVRTRELPASGEIFVQVGDSVTPEQVVGRASLEGDLAMLRIPEKLGLDAITVVEGLRDRGMVPGRSISEGEILCSYRGLFGLFRNEYVSPVSGEIEILSERTGHLGVRLPPGSIDVKAYLGGKVTAVVPGRSVTIAASVGFVQGIFGVGGERFGVLKPLNCKREDKVTMDALPLECEGAVLFGGTAPTGEILQEAARRGAVGLIVGAIDDRALTQYLGYDIGIALTGDERIPMDVIITEGFGALPMSERVASLLSRRGGSACSINGATQVRAGAVRPEVILHVGHAEGRGMSEALVSDALSVGTRIRLIRVPYFGAIGEVVELPHPPALLETGAYARVLKAKLDDGRIVDVPRANVELLS